VKLEFSTRLISYSTKKEQERLTLYDKPKEEKPVSDLSRDGLQTSHLRLWICSFLTTFLRWESEFEEKKRNFDCEKSVPF